MSISQRRNVIDTVASHGSDIIALEYLKDAMLVLGQNARTNTNSTQPFS